MRLGFLASHSGTNVQAVVNAIKNGALDAEAALVISNNRDAEVLERAERESIPWAHLSGKTHPDPTHLDAAILEALQTHRVEIVILAGFMKKLGPQTLAAYRSSQKSEETLSTESLRTFPCHPTWTSRPSRTEPR